MQIGQVAGVNTLLLSSFDNPTDSWALVVSTTRRDKSHLSLGLALEKLLY